jgi:AmmeMemoRadiSam system protein B
MKCVEELVFEPCSKDVDNNEHSIEMQMPFLAAVCPSARVMPIYVGQCDYELCAKKMEHLFRDPKVLFVVSSDFCHWGASYGFVSGSPPYNEHIRTMDATSIHYIQTGDIVSFASDKNTVCGRHPILLLMHLIKNTNTKINSELVVYKQSNTDITEPSMSSVSYVGIKFTEK